MSHVVLSHTVSLRTSPGPRNLVPQDTVRAQAHRWYAKPIAGAPAHRPCSGPWSVFRRTASAQAYCPCSGPWSVSGALLVPGALSVLRPMVSVLTAHGRCSSASSVPTAHGRCPGPWSVLWPMVSAPAHGQPPGPSSVLQPMVSPQAHYRYPTRLVSTPAPCRCSGSLLVRTAHGRCANTRPVPTPNTGTHAEAVPTPTGGVQTAQTEDQRPARRSPRPNKGVQATANKLRSCVAPLVGRA
jgi:hypothetical protein